MSPREPDRVEVAMRGLVEALAADHDASPEHWAASVESVSADGSHRGSRAFTDAGTRIADVEAAHVRVWARINAVIVDPAT